MITVLTGSNDYAIKAELRRQIDRFDGLIERVEGVDLELNRFADLVAGGGLFAERKLVVIEDLSKNKVIWAVLLDWLQRVDDDTILILIEPKLDKRTTTYKALKSKVEITELANWTDRDQGMALKWTKDEAAKRGLEMDNASVAELVRRSMVSTDKPGRLEIDQWRIHYGLEKLRAADAVTPDVVADLIDTELRENSFELLEAVLSGNISQLQNRLDILRLQEEPHRLLGLLSAQAYQLTVLSYAQKPVSAVAADIGAHPFVMDKLSALARRLGRAGAKQLVSTLAETDMQMKSSGHDPWLLVESMLLRLAVR